jgi:sugar lactone lactonase YvrE
MKRPTRLPSLVALLFVATTAAANDYAEARADLVAAYQAQDYPAMIEAAGEALRARPGYPGARFNLALAYALNGDAAASLETLSALLDEGIDFGVDEMEQFAALRDSAGWREFTRRTTVLREPVGEASIAFQSDDPHFVPEGIAIDDSGRVYLGSIRKGQLLRDGEIISERAGHWSVFGMRFDPGGNLWFASAAVPQFDDAGEDLGKTGLFRLDVETGEITRAAILPQFAEEQLLGDLVIHGNTIYTTDSLTGAVYRYDIGTDTFHAVIERGVLGSPQGLALDETGRYLYVADYIGGLYRLALDHATLSKVTVSGGVNDYGIDGLYRHGEHLVAIQNGIRPHRVATFELGDGGLRIVDGQVLAASLPEFDEPTLGAVHGKEFYFVANSHWNRFDRENRLPDGLTGPIVLKIRIPQDCVLDNHYQNNYSVLP